MSPPTVADVFCFFQPKSGNCTNCLNGINLLVSLRKVRGNDDSDTRGGGM
jgi:hypothetical protein